jgi:hypothetical protein
MDTYRWELTENHLDFYGGKWKCYEDTNGYSDEQMERTKELFVKGNTAAFHEISKLREGATLTVTLPHDEEYCVYFKNGSLQVDSNTGDEISFGVPRTIEEIREVVDYLTTSNDYLPINCIQSIKKGAELVF